MVHRRTALTDTVSELAADFRNRQFHDQITEKDALPYVNAPVVDAWITKRLETDLASTVLADIAGELSLADGLIALRELCGLGNSTRHVLSQKLKAFVARDIAHDAQKLLDDGPGDEPYDDPRGRDLRALAREHNAIARAVGL
jgi:hypothetical protein